MTNADLDYLESVLQSGILKGPVLELGAGYGGWTGRELVTNAGLEYFASDAFPSAGVTYICDFEQLKPGTFDRQFESVLVFNVLEHTFQPLTVADAALSLVAPGGHLVILTPTVWSIHEYPIDCYRLLPQWYERFAETRGIRLLREHFKFIPGGLVENYRKPDGGLKYPPPSNLKWKMLRSRIVHKLFDTTGRGMFMSSNLATAATFQVGHHAGHRGV
jgi:SAM-dependent methyltransferase